MARGQLAPQPAFSATSLMTSAARPVLSPPSQQARLAHDLEQEFAVIAAGGRGQLVQEALDDPGHGAGTRRAPRTAGRHQRQQGLRELVVRHVQRGEFLARAGCRRSTGVLAVGA